MGEKGKWGMREVSGEVQVEGSVLGGEEGGRRRKGRGRRGERGEGGWRWCGGVVVTEEEEEAEEDAEEAAGWAGEEEEEAGDGWRRRGEGVLREGDRLDRERVVQFPDAAADAILLLEAH